MRFWLETPNASRPPITLVEMRRLCFGETPISAPHGYQLLVKTRSHGYRAAGFDATLRYLRGMVERHPGSAAAVKEIPRINGEK